jgi:hypothetical protein
MPFAYSADPSLIPIERPRCPKCQGRMMLARIEPGPAHSDLRTFECPKCQHIHKVLGDRDPYHSPSLGPGECLGPPVTGIKGQGAGYATSSSSRTLGRTSTASS